MAAMGEREVRLGVPTMKGMRRVKGRCRGKAGCRGGQGKGNQSRKMREPSFSRHPLNMKFVLCSRQKTGIGVSMDPLADPPGDYSSLYLEEPTLCKNDRLPM